MSDYPPEFRYAITHEWIGEDETGVFRIGISNFAQEQLGDVVFVELPEEGASLGAGEEACSIESVKAASDIYCPIAGTVVEVNDTLEDEPELVNEDPYGDGWIFKIKPLDADAVTDLMEASEYMGHCEGGPGLEDGED